MDRVRGGFVPSSDKNHATARTYGPNPNSSRRAGTSEMPVGLMLADSGIDAGSFPYCGLTYGSVSNHLVAPL